MSSVQFLGSGDAFGSGGRLQTCILVQDGDWRVLLDCGTTALIGLKRALIDPASIDLVVVSHLHGDHFAGLPFVILDAQFNSKRSKPLTIAGHQDLESRLRQTMEILFPGSQRAFDLVEVRFVTLAPHRPAAIGSAQVEAFEVKHFCGSPPFAVRLTTPTGGVVGYSGDTEWTDTLSRVAEASDVFIAEAYFPDKLVKGHLDYRTLLEHLPELRSQRLIATHMSANMLGYHGQSEIQLAYDGLRIEL